MNAFESGARRVVPTVLVLARAEGALLMVHRAKPGDFHAGKWNALGGKLEADESPLEAARRELAEEAGLELAPERFASRGVVTFPRFKPEGRKGGPEGPAQDAPAALMRGAPHDVIMFLFEAVVTPAERATARGECDHGELRWVAEAEVAGLPLWPGDREFLPRVLAGESVVGTVWYRDGEVERAWIAPASADRR